MQSTTRFTTRITTALCLLGSLCLPAELLAAPPEPFSDSNLSDWKERELAGSTSYRLVDRDGIAALEAHTDKTASILYRKQQIDLTETPELKWWWQVDTLYDGIDQQSKSGDDFPARLYVVARLGKLPWNTLALNYVWTTSVPEGTIWKNPFTDKAAMIAVQSGSEDLGEWVFEQRNVAEDFKQAFGREIDEIAGYAVMADGDNAGLEATSWFGSISFHP